MTEKQPVKIRTIIEILGRPEEHIINTMKLMIAKLKGEEGISVLKEFISDAEKQDDLFSIFSELELELDSYERLISFTFGYMPSVIEILDPEHLALSNRELTNFMTDIQGRIHTIDGKLKMANQENVNLSRTVVMLAKNSIICALRLKQDGMNKQIISKVTGIVEQDLDQFLEMLLKEEKIIKANDEYKININYSEKTKKSEIHGD